MGFKRKRTYYSKEFGAETVKLVLEGAASVSAVARDLGVAQRIKSPAMKD